MLDYLELIYLMLKGTELNNIMKINSFHMSLKLYKIIKKNLLVSTMMQILINLLLKVLHLGGKLIQQV